jgi:Regulator of polyketide synthase expression
MELVAGKGGLNNKIYWMHVAETSENVEKLFNWLKPGDFLIIIGHILKNDPDALFDIINKSIEFKLSGVLIYESKSLPQVPKYIIQIADEHNFPVFFLKDEDVSAIEIVYDMGRMILSDLEYHDVYEKLLKDIYYGMENDEEALIARANFYNYDLTSSHRGVAFKFNTEKCHVVPAESSKRDLIENISKTCADILTHYYSYILCMNSEDTFYALLPANIIDASVESIAVEIVQTLREQYGGIKVFGGIGHQRSLLKNFRASIEEANEIVQILSNIGMANTIKKYSQMYAYMMIFEMREKEILKKLHKALFNNLINYDATHNSNLKNVLRVYLYEDKNSSITAKKLYLHRNTLTYQLKKIEELCGKDLTSPMDCFELMLGFYIEDILKWSVE